MEPVVIVPCPDVIYLQGHGDEPDAQPGTMVDYDGQGDQPVTWCADQINGSDTRYLLATPERDAASDLLAALRALVALPLYGREDTYEEAVAKTAALQLASDALKRAEGAQP